MSAYSAPIDVFRKALPLIGAEPPSSIADQSHEAVAANAVYEGMVEDLLCEHAWTFATKRATLTYQGESGDKPTYIYALPSDVLRVRRVLYALRPFRDYELRAGALYCDLSSNTDLDLIYNWRAPESSWSSDFGMCVVYKLAAAVARAFERREDAADFERMAEDKLARARARDRQASGNVEVFGNTLGDIWGTEPTRTYTRVASS
jgi:hypothetical protein